MICVIASGFAFPLIFADDLLVELPTRLMRFVRVLPYCAIPLAKDWMMLPLAELGLSVDEGIDAEPVGSILSGITSSVGWTGIIL